MNILVGLVMLRVVLLTQLTIVSLESSRKILQRFFEYVLIIATKGKRGSDGAGVECEKSISYLNAF